MQALSTPLVRALVDCSADPVFLEPDDRETEPLDDGTFTAGLGGVTAPQQLLILPFARGNVGGRFLMRLYGWWHCGPSEDATNVIWLPLIMAEFDCTIGPRGGLASRVLKDGEMLANTIVLTKGDLGTYGRLVSPGGWDAGHITIDLHGCRKYQFKFAPSTDVPGGQGNALFGKTSAF